MDRTGVSITVFAADLVATFGDLLVSPAPQTGRPRQVQDRHHGPKQWQPAAEVSNRFAAAVAIPAGIDDIHLGHQIVVREVRVSLGHSGVMQRNETQPPAATIQSAKIPHLPLAKSAIAIVDHDVGLGRLIGIGKGTRFSHRCVDFSGIQCVSILVCNRIQ